MEEMKGNRLNYYVKYADKPDGKDACAWIIYWALVNIFYALVKNFDRVIYDIILQVSVTKYNLESDRKSSERLLN